MKKIILYNITGDFAEDKDAARKIRLEEINIEIDKNQKVELDFSNVTSATQSFIHALISQVIRDNGSEVLDKVLFKGCNAKIRAIIEIVVEYVQDGMYAEPVDDSELTKSIEEMLQRKTTIKRGTKHYTKNNLGTQGKLF